MLLYLNPDKSNFLLKSSLINDLVDMRNRISHGERTSYDKELVITTARDALQLLEEFKTMVENNALLKSFKSEPGPLQQAE